MSSKKPVAAAAKKPTKTVSKPAGGGAPSKGKAAASKKPSAPAKASEAMAAAPAPAPAEPPKPKILPVVEIGLKEINVVFNDSEGKIKESGRWPLVIDENERVIVFARHRDCNNMDAMDTTGMQPENIRRALLGAIKHGKPMTINLGECGSIDIVVDRFNEVMPDLMELVLTKKILEDDRYMKLVRPNDGEEYQQIFGAMETFNFVFITSNPSITDDTKSKVIVFKVV